MVSFYITVRQITEMFQLPKYLSKKRGASLLSFFSKIDCCGETKDTTSGT